MRIVFNLLKCGLGNNGGSLTIIKSVNTLVDMGHEVYILDDNKNYNTWEPLKAPYIDNINKLEKSDAIIATGYNTVKSTIQVDDRYGYKMHWIRGWETWILPENEIVEKILKRNTIKLVNGFQLQRKLDSYNIQSYILRPGYDFEEIYPSRDRTVTNQPIVLGGLYNTRHTSKRSDWIFETYNLLKNKYPLKLYMMGTNVKPDDCDEYFKSPTIDNKRYFYNSCDIWLAPTENEGLHICPAEAMMTKCPVVGTNSEMSGMEDYLIDNETGVVTNNNFDDFVNGVESLIQTPDKRIQLGEQGLERIKFLGDRKKNMNQLINLIFNIVKLTNVENPFKHE